MAIGGAIAFLGDCAIAQIVPDRTLPNNSIVTPSGNTSMISGGTQAGSNLFHSFDAFSVPTGGEAHFNNALNIQNIISRVTGSSISNIDGLIRANGTANLFLLNPNGIIFGSNAKLNIGGSFVGSTASAVNFADGSQFSATAPQATPLLTVSVPIGLQFGRTAGGIQVRESILQVLPGQTLALMGGNVSVEGGKFGFLSAPEGRIELGGLAGAGTVDIEEQQSEGAFGLTKLRFPNSVERADILLTNSAYVNVAGGGGGSIAINARNLDVSGGSILRGGLEKGKGISNATAGDITLNATREIAIANGGVIANNLRTEAVGKGGNIEITSVTLSVTNGAQLQASTFGQGDGGSVTINARDTVSLDGVSSDGAISGVFSSVEAGAVGKVSGINITTESLLVKNGAQLLASTRGQGDAGSVTINARDTVSFDGVGSKGSSGVFSSVEAGAVGKVSGINITTESLLVKNGAQLLASTRGQGDAGSVTINARDVVSFDGVNSDGTPSGAFSSVEKEAVGKGSGINITTGSLLVKNGAQLLASTHGQGDAGSVTIYAENTVSFDGVNSNGLRLPTGAGSEVAAEAVGNGGGISITTGSLLVKNGAQLVASTLGQGDAGSVTINARDTVSFDRVNSGGIASGAFSSVEARAVGNGGGISIMTGSLLVKNGAQLLASTRGQGDAGSVTINACNAVSFDGVNSDGTPSGAFSTVQEEAVGKGGSVNITTGSLSLTNGGGLSASSVGSGAAGNIEVSASSIRLDNGAFLRSNTVGGEGNISLRSPSLILRRGSSITTNANGSNIIGGNITIDTDVLAALKNSDISANSDQFFGGEVIIDASGIFGTEFRDAQTKESDITATGGSPELSGTVEINTPDVDPAQGLVNLPNVPIETEVVQACTPGGSQANSEFIITGHGGLPPNPTDFLNTDAVWIDLDSTTQQAENRPRFEEATQPTNSTAQPLVEATGWAINDKGEVVLIASVPTATHHIPRLTPANCHAPQNPS